MEMIDFAQYAKNVHSYGGSDNKKCIEMDNKVYMVKLPNKKENPNSLQTSVSNNVISEYVGSHIMQSLDLDAQNTLLGYWGKDIVVACEDFREEGWELQAFTWVMQDIIDQKEIGRIPTYEQLYKVFNESPIVQNIRQEALERYWDTIVGDALIGNFDRHKDNFGYLVKRGEAIKNAPIYDCGSCLYPDLSEERFQDVLSNMDEIKMRIYQFPKIALNKNPNKNREEKFGYFELLSSNFDKECTKAFFRIYDRIDISKINAIIDNTPLISDVRKNFYKQMLSYRKELILDRSYEILIGLPDIQNNKDYYFSKPTETAISKSHIQTHKNVLNTEKSLGLKKCQPLDDRLKQIRETRESQAPQERSRFKSNSRDDR